MMMMMIQTAQTKALIVFRTINININQLRNLLSCAKVFEPFLVSLYFPSKFLVISKSCLQQLKVFLWALAAFSLIFSPGLVADLFWGNIIFVC